MDNLLEYEGLVYSIIGKYSGYFDKDDLYQVGMLGLMDAYNHYKENMNTTKYLPNITHEYLKRLEDMGKLKGVVTQNIDGLHQKAGSKNVYEIHGTILKNHCIKVEEMARFLEEYLDTDNLIRIYSTENMKYLHSYIDAEYILESRLPRTREDVLPVMNRDLFTDIG